jgi:DNA primase
MRGRIVIAKPPKRNVVAVGSVELTHADRPLWPGIAKLDLAEYWLAVVEHAPPELVRMGRQPLRRPCPRQVPGLRC